MSKDKRPKCPRCGTPMVKNGTYTRSDGTKVQRYRCPKCGKTLSDASKKLENRPKCPRCGTPMRKNGYWTKSDGTLMQRYRCPKCGKSISQPTGVKVEKRRKKAKKKQKDLRRTVKIEKPILLDDLLKHAIKVDRCIFCGSNKIIKKGAYTVLNGLIKIQRFMCKKCRRTFSRLTILRLMLKQFYPECPICKEIANIIRKGRLKRKIIFFLQKMQS